MVEVGLIIYLGLGVVVLCAFDLMTRRIRQRLFVASVETQDKLLQTGNMIGRRAATALLMGATLVFWPVVIWGAIRR